MSESIRNPRAEPFHPNAQIKAANSHATAQVIRDRHAAAAALAAQAVNGGKLTAADKQTAADFLEAVAAVLGWEGAHADAFMYALEDATGTVRLRRRAAEAAAA